jgi:predicted permease
MSGWLIVLLKIAVMFLVILMGWVARRRDYLTEETTGSLSKFVVDVTIPALVFTQMLATVNAESLRISWYIPLLGIGVLLIGQLVGISIAPLCNTTAQCATFVFLVAFGNWVYLPLPIAEGLYGAEGIRIVLLFNLGAQLVLWTVGVWTIHGGKPDMDSLRNLATNPGLIATVAGILLAVGIPATQTLGQVNLQSSSSPSLLFGHTLIQALTMIGSLTIPLSLITTGAQLGGLDISDHRPSLAFYGVLISRLLVTPIITIVLFVLIALAGITIPEAIRIICYIIAAMPVAVSCCILTERFGGDTSLATRTIFYSTLISILSVPAILYVIQWLAV